MNIPQRIEALLEAALADYGYAVVLVRVLGKNRPTLQIMIERLDEIPITVKDCTIVSRVASVHLDVENLFRNSFILEVSSPGIERPLIKAKDYQRFCNQRVMVTLNPSVDTREERQKLPGKIIYADDEEIVLEVEGLEDSLQQKIKIATIKSAHLLKDFAKVGQRFNLK